ncbi:MAG: hypothetical protein JWQ70_3030 [Aeromicrobium sp.]|jgi:hypothetical protein|nr:hypothetical protein [Aeromicrobium sp.]
MTARSRLPKAALALVALVLGVVIAMRVSAGADPAPQNTNPIVIGTPQTTTPTTDPSDQPRSNDDYTHITPEPRDINDDGGHQSGKDGGGDDGGVDNSGKGSSGDDGGTSGGSGSDNSGKGSSGSGDD